MTARKYAGHTLAEIKAAAEGMRGWKIEEARRVGDDEICEFGTEHDGEWYPLGTVDGQTYTSNPADDLVIARHIVTANPATVLDMAARIVELEALLQSASVECNATANERNALRDLAARAALSSGALVPADPPALAQHAWFSQAALDVTAERRRQIEAEGWTPEHDDQHGAHELAEAAACYSLASAGKPFDYFETMWPWEQHWFKPADARRNLVKAAALLLAEIERLDRAASKPEGGCTGSRYPAELVESDGGEV